MKDVLEVDDPANTRRQVVHGLGQIPGERHVGENAEVGGVEKSQSGLSLQLPEVAVCVDDAVSCTPRVSQPDLGMKDTLGPYQTNPTTAS